MGRAGGDKPGRPSKWIYREGNAKREGQVGTLGGSAWRECLEAPPPNLRLRVDTLTNPVRSNACYAVVCEDSALTAFLQEARMGGIPCPPPRQREPGRGVEGESSGLFYGAVPSGLSPSAKACAAALLRRLSSFVSFLSKKRNGCARAAPSQGFAHKRSSVCARAAPSQGFLHKRSSVCARACGHLTANDSKYRW